MAYNSDGYIMLDFTEVDFRRTNQTIEGLFKRCVDVIGTNKFILVINANGRTPLPATCSFTNNQYVIDTVIYMFAVSSNDHLFIRRNDVPASDIIDDSSISVDKTWSSNKIDSELDGKQDTLTAGTNITIDENNVISSTGGAVIDDSVIVNNKVWSSLNTIEKLAPIDTIVNNPAVFNTSLELPIVECSTSIMAIQEGSGDPSPSNVRPIHGFSEVNATRAGKNLVDKSLLIQSPAVSQPFLCKIGADSFNSNIPNGSIVLASGQYTFSCIYKNDSSKNNTQLSVYDENGNNLYTRYTVKSIKFTVPKSMAVCFYINCGASGFTSWDDYDIQLEVGSTATAYEPYVTPTIYTIQLGQEVYGAEVDVVNGVARLSHYGYVCNNDTILTLTGSGTGLRAISIDYATNNLPQMKSGAQGQAISNLFSKNIPSGTEGRLSAGETTAFFLIDTSRLSTADSAGALEWAVNNQLTFVYPIETPIEISLSDIPTISTLIGNNTIFVDTGNIKVSYRHLPIDLI